MPAPGAPPAEEDHGSWYEALDLSAFVDAYASLNFNMGKPQSDANAFRAFDRSNGFSLSWAGLDVGYSSEEVGATVALRFGPSTKVLSGQDANDGLQFVKQAYATWRPGAGHFSFDFGKFDTIYGVEVADSQKNINYTRGLLYTLAQPHFHTGLRASFADQGFSVSALVVNGWNDSIDKNLGKGLGLDVGYAIKRSDNSGNLLTVKLGYLMSPESLDYYPNQRCPQGQVLVPPGDACDTVQPTPQGSEIFTVDRGETNKTSLRHFLDLVLLLEPIDPLLVTLNVDYGHDDHVDQTEQGTSGRTGNWIGLALAGRYRFSDVFALGLRGEYLNDENGFLCDSTERVTWFNSGVPSLRGACSAALAATPADQLPSGVGFASGTATIEVSPVDHLLLRLDGRFDHASEQVFPIIHTNTNSQFTTTLGIVAMTD